MEGDTQSTSLERERERREVRVSSLAVCLRHETIFGGEREIGKERLGKKRGEEKKKKEKHMWKCRQFFLLLDDDFMTLQSNPLRRNK